MDKTPAAWCPRASKNVRGTVNCNRDEGTTPQPDHSRNAVPTFCACSAGSSVGFGPRPGTP
jgi:hypothetical protein